MKKKLLSFILATALVLALAIPASAADNTCVFVYNGTEYPVTGLQGRGIWAATIGEIVNAIKGGTLQNGEESVTALTITNPILICNNKYIASPGSAQDTGLNYTQTLSTLGIKSGDKINVYKFGDAFCIVRYQGKDYALDLTGGNTLSKVKTAIAADAALTAANGGTAIAVEDQLLCDSSGNFLTQGDLSSGSIVYLYTKAAGEITITSTDTGYNDYKKPVTATYQTGAAADTTYSVTVEWGSMVFTYRAPQKVWNPETHAEVDGSGNGTFTCEDRANQITVKNHSNADVKVTFDFKANSNYYATGSNDGFTGEASNNTATELTDYAIILDSAVGKATDKPATVTASLNLTGALKTDPGDNPIGAVTVTIEASNT